VPCGRPDFLEAIPPDEATEVPLNATLSALYTSSAQYLDEPVTLEQVGGETLTLTATFNQNEGILTVTPPAPLQSQAQYRVTWPRLRGLTVASLGQGAEVEFSTGSITDLQPPKFDGLSGISWDLKRENDVCTDSLEERFVFDLALGAIEDDGGLKSLTLVVFQTTGSGIVPGTPEPVLVTHVPELGKSVQVERSVRDTTGRVCFAAVVRDSRMSASGGANKEVCVKTAKPPFFYGCSTGRGSSGVGWVLFTAAIGLGLTRRAMERPAVRNHVGSKG
jgi:hypothetical protein